MLVTAEVIISLLMFTIMSVTLNAYYSLILEGNQQDEIISQQ